MQASNVRKLALAALLTLRQHPVRVLAMTFVLATTALSWRAWQGHARVDLVTFLPGVSFEFPVMFLSRPMDMRSFVVEKRGVVKWIDEEQKAIGGVFLDLSAKVSSEGPEDGLLSIAFPPKPATHSYLYAFYTLADPPRSRIVRYPIPDEGPVNIEQETLLFEIEKPGAGHNGGLLQFGPDGYLYISIGDGLTRILKPRAEYESVLQSRQNFLGKLLRIDPTLQDGDRIYSIPADNPFRNANDDSRSEIYAYGLRNPWRFTFTANQELILADVGAGKKEEVNRVLPGRNYGWPIMEGEVCHLASDKGRCDRSHKELPLGSFSHRDVMTAITGAIPYVGSQIPWLRGKLVISSFEHGIFAMDYPTDALITKPEVLFSVRSWSHRTEAKGLRISSIHTGHDQEIYLVNYDGALLRMVKRSYHQQWRDFFMTMFNFQ